MLNPLRENVCNVTEIVETNTYRRECINMKNTYETAPVSNAPSITMRL